MMWPRKSVAEWKYVSQKNILNSYLYLSILHGKMYPNYKLLEFASGIQHMSYLKN